MKQLFLFTATFNRHPAVGLAVFPSGVRPSRRIEAFYTLSGAPIAKPKDFSVGTFLGEFATPEEFWEIVEDLQDFGDADRALKGKPIESLVADDDDDAEHAVPTLPKRKRRRAA
jgi:hypothetical protein